MGGGVVRGVKERLGVVLILTFLLFLLLFWWLVVFILLFSLRCRAVWRWGFLFLSDYM